MKKQESHYELLKVDPRATVSEIATAYHTARNAFSKDSIAIYSLFSPEETESMLKKLEEAYLTLSNLDRKREYDRKLNGDFGAETPPPVAEVKPVEEIKIAPAAVLPLVPSALGGAFLRETREQKGMSIEDVSRLTKIPNRTLKAIETDELKKLPARVYLQGFVTNLCKVYRVDPVATTKTYLENLDRLIETSKAS